MILRKIKLSFGFFVLFAYVSMGVLGLFKFNHTMETFMPDCPYAQSGYALCTNHLDHINAWQQFSNVIPSSVFFLSLLALTAFLYFFNKQDLINLKPYFYKWKCYLDIKQSRIYLQKISKWLALLVNSPSPSYTA